MIDQPPVDLGALVTNLLQQQTALTQQLAALLQVHGESVRLQGVLADWLMGISIADISAFSGHPALAVRSDALLSADAPPPTQLIAPTATSGAPAVAAQRPDRAAEPPPQPAAEDAAPLSPVVVAGGGRGGSHAVHLDANRPGKHARR